MLDAFPTTAEEDSDLLRSIGMSESGSAKGPGDCSERPAEGCIAEVSRMGEEAQVWFHRQHLCMAVSFRRARKVLLERLRGNMLAQAAFAAPSW